jgi:hypothetical protein
MDLDPARLRTGEIVAGASGVLLLACLFVLPWYGVNHLLARIAAQLGVSTTSDGWNSLSHARWLMLVTAVAALALSYFQAARRAPAVPASLGVIVTVLGLLSLLWLLYRVLLNVPGPDNLLEQRVGAYLGLAAAVGILYGGYQSMRREGTLDRDGPASIETVRLPSEGSS